MRSDAPIIFESILLYLTLGWASSISHRETLHSLHPDSNSNQNGRDVISLCNALNITLINHLKTEMTSHKGGLTFRRKKKWISQLDWAFVSKEIVHSIKNFDIIQDDTLPTDHAAITLEVWNIKALEEDVKQRTPANHCKKTIRSAAINEELFKRSLPAAETVTKTNDNMDNLIKTITDALYETALQSRNPNTTSDHEINENSRSVTHFMEQKYANFDFG